MPKKPDVLAKKLGLIFDQPQLFILALTHRSIGAKNNERLEYLGDSVLGFVIALKLYQIFPDASEGELSRLRASLVNQESLAELAREHSIGDYLILGSGELKSGGFRRDSILSDALEAIIGAILKDRGVQVCQDWILALFSRKLAELDINNCQKDPKTQLQELIQAKKHALPAYELIKMTDAAYVQTFSVKCTTNLIAESSMGDGASIKRAEQDAAEKMLFLINSKKA